MIPLRDRIYQNDRALQRLPTVEAQLLAWSRYVDTGQVSRCLHLQRGGYTVYVRRSHRSLPGLGECVAALDIAAVQLTPRLRSKGWFRCFLELADAIIPWDATLVECVHNPRLAAYLPTAGFLCTGDINFYRPSKRWRERQLDGGSDSTDFRQDPKRALRTSVPCC